MTAIEYKERVEYHTSKIVLAEVAIQLLHDQYIEEHIGLKPIKDMEVHVQKGKSILKVKIGSWGIDIETGKVFINTQSSRVYADNSWI